jgi:hypothetical protein
MAASFSNIMKRYQIPIAQWSVQDVQEWLGEIGLGNLNGAIEHNAGWFSCDSTSYISIKNYILTLLFTCCSKRQ